MLNKINNEQVRVTICYATMTTSICIYVLLTGTWLAAFACGLCAVCIVYALNMYIYLCT